MAIETVLFDIGNVLSHDGHDTFLMHPEFGILRNTNVTYDDMSTKTAPVFRKYAIRANADEKDFWNDIRHALGVNFSDDSIILATQNITYTNKEAQITFDYVKDRNIKLGVISNSTPMFYPDVAARLDLSDNIESNLYFLSHEKGVLKSNGLFERAAEDVDPASTLIIEDRLKNVLYADRLGFSTLLYSYESNESLFQAVKDKLISLN